MCVGGMGGGRVSTRAEQRMTLGTQSLSSVIDEPAVSPSRRFGNWEIETEGTKGVTGGGWQGMW